MQERVPRQGGKVEYDLQPAEIWRRLCPCGKSLGTTSNTEYRCMTIDIMIISAWPANQPGIGTGLLHVRADHGSPIRALGGEKVSLVTSIRWPGSKSHSLHPCVESRLEERIGCDLPEWRQLSFEAK